MSSPDDTWWNPRTQRWEPGPQPSDPAEPEYAAQPQPMAAPQHPALPEPAAGTEHPAAPPAPPAADSDAPSTPEPPAGTGYPAAPEPPAGTEHPTRPGHPAGPGQPAAPQHPAGPEYPGAPQYLVGPRYPAAPAHPAQPEHSAPPGAEDVTRVAGGGQGAGPAWYEQPARQGWHPGPGNPAQGLPPLPPRAAPGYEAWPPLPPVPPPPHQEPGQGRPWRMPLLVGVVAAVVGGASVAAWMLLGDKTAPPSDARPPTPSASSPVTPGPGTPSTGAPSSGSPTPSGSPSPSTRPGFTLAHDADGFSVAVPTGWGPSRDEQGGGAFYRPPGGDRSALLQIFRISEPASTGSCELLRMSSARLGDNTPAYQQVSVTPVDGTGCELVYEYDSAESHGRRRGMERIVTTPDGNRWALLAAGPATDATTTRANLTAALDSFRPD
ncbi:hypothetical protein [Streptomyces sp. NPDC001594]|uniref:hypothetical protein n=1 Tax=Streptomyces sp. NPDC001594 TaxID=3364590 RepID=UPI00368AA977